VSEKNKYEEDYDLLWNELDNSYPYIKYIDENIVDVDELRNRYAKEIESVEDDADFLNLIQRMFNEMNNLGHLDVLNQQLYQECYYIYVLSDFSNEDFASTYSKVLQDKRVSDIYTKPASQEKFESKEFHSDNVYTNYYPEQKALYFRISSFAYNLKNQDRNVFSDEILKYPEAENVIFDITGNGGGSDDYWIDNIVAPFGGNYEMKSRSFYKESATTDRYFGKGEYSVSTTELTDVPEWVNTLELDRCIVSKTKIPDESQNENIIPRNIKRWVLTGPNTYSSSEKFAYFCKTTGWATIVGTPTSGDGLNASPILVLLPNTGLLIRFSCLAGENADGAMNGISGTAPDYITIKGETALQRCLDLIMNSSN
jgi:hypothetical protein